jgi:hypothetical protein
MLPIELSKTSCATPLIKRQYSSTAADLSSTTFLSSNSLAMRSSHEQPRSESETRKCTPLKIDDSQYVNTFAKLFLGRRRNMELRFTVVFVNLARPPFDE